MEVPPAVRAQDPRSVVPDPPAASGSGRRVLRSRPLAGLLLLLGTFAVLLVMAGPAQADDRVPPRHGGNLPSAAGVAGERDVPKTVLLSVRVAIDAPDQDVSVGRQPVPEPLEPGGPPDQVPAPTPDPDATPPPVPAPVEIPAPDRGAPPPAVSLEAAAPDPGAGRDDQSGADGEVAQPVLPEGPPAEVVPIEAPVDIVVEEVVADAAPETSVRPPPASAAPVPPAAVPAELPSGPPTPDAPADPGALSLRATPTPCPDGDQSIRPTARGRASGVAPPAAARGADASAARSQEARPAPVTPLSPAPHPPSPPSGQQAPPATHAPGGSPSAGASCHSGSGSGSGPGADSDLAVLTAARNAAIIRLALDVSTGVTGHSSEGADQPGDRPD